MKKLLALLLILVVSASTSCAWWQSTGKKIAQDVLDCSLEAVKSSAPQLVTRIYEIMSGNPANWGAALAALEVAGWDALGCAVHAVMTDLQTKRAQAAKAGLGVQVSVHDQRIDFLRGYAAGKKLLVKNPLTLAPAGGK